MEFLRLKKLNVKILTSVIARLISVLVVFLLMFSACSAYAASPSEDEIKAAFVYNFAKFVEWPDMSAKKIIEVGYLGDKPLSGNLALLANRKVKDLGISVVPLNEPEEMISAEIIFIPASEDKRIHEIIKTTSDAPVLLVSDAPDFVRNGGTIGLKIAGNRLRFDVNLKAANARGLKISSQLLSLAMEVIR